MALAKREAEANVRQLELAAADLDDQVPGSGFDPWAISIARIRVASTAQAKRAESGSRSRSGPPAVMLVYSIAAGQLPIGSKSARPTTAQAGVEYRVMRGQTVVRPSSSRSRSVTGPENRRGNTYRSSALTATTESGSLSRHSHGQRETTVHDGTRLGDYDVGWLECRLERAVESPRVQCSKGVTRRHRALQSIVEPPPHVLG